MKIKYNYFKKVGTILKNIYSLKLFHKIDQMPTSIYTVISLCLSRYQ